MRACWIFPAAIAWKFLLALAFALPVPANDAFFFDGAVVEWLGGGGYVNPTIGQVFPTSATAFFSAYPPGYQAVLAVWMTLFGPTVEASLALHCALFAVYALLALAVLRRAGAPAFAANLGGCFLFGITFHDRPDSLAHVLGLLAFWLWLEPDPARARRRRPWAALCAVLAMATSLHIGAMYAAMLWGCAALRAKTCGWPWRSLLATIVVPVGLALLVVKYSPTAWQGFQENLATQNSVRFRLPAADDVARAIRYAPGLMVVAGFMLAAALRRRPMLRREEPGSSAAPVLGALLGASGFAVVASLCVAPPYYVAIAAYPQVLVVALWFWLRPEETFAARPFRRRARTAARAGAIALVSLRAIALSTWGVWCALDVGKSAAVAEARRAVEALPVGAEVVVSSAYLYDLAGDNRVKKIHSDWIGRYGPAGGARPALFVLTPFDYYRRFRDELAAKRSEMKSLTVSEIRRRPVPDESRWLQRVAPHLSWAPVIVRVEWR